MGQSEALREREGGRYGGREGRREEVTLLLFLLLSLLPPLAATRGSGMDVDGGS